MNFEYTVIIEQKVSIGLQLQKRIKISSLYNPGETYIQLSIYFSKRRGVVTQKSLP